MQCIGHVHEGFGVHRRCRAGAERDFRTCPSHRIEETAEQQELDLTGSLSAELPPYEPTDKYHDLMAELKANIRRYSKTR